jgi:hypothetical protein
MSRQSSYLNTPITIIFATSDRSNAKIKSKTIKNRTIDDLIEANYIIPGIPEKAVIKEVAIGSSPDFLNRYFSKYNLPTIDK